MKRVHRFEHEVMTKIKAIAVNADTALEGQKDEAGIYLSEINKIGKEIKKIAKHKVADKLKTVSV
jgi:archaellum component FlaC